MKIDYDKKHPFTSVDMTFEDNEEEYLTQEQTAKLRKIGLRCVRISYLCFFFAIVASVFTMFDKTHIILFLIGHIGLVCLIVSIVLLFVEYKKLEKLSKEYENKK